MPNSETAFRVGLVILAAASLTSRADELSLAGDARLTGRIRSINQDGLVELESKLSPEPILLKPEAVRKVTFEASGDGASLPEGLVELSNGDLLPASVVDLDEKTLKMSTPDAGMLEVRRTSLRSIQFGVHRQRTIYSGPRNLEEWTKEVDGAKNWRYSKESLLANGPAVAIRKIEIPERFVFKFTLKWQKNPNFTVYFADPLSPKSDNVDRYLFQFGSSGFEIKRESGGTPRIQSVIELSRGPDEFPSNQVDVELRVDRKASKIHLYLNGEPEKSGLDPVDEPPDGSGFVFVSSSPIGNTQEIRGIQVLDFDDTRQRHHSEDRGNPKLDSMISRDDDRWSGHLQGIHQESDGMVLIFKSDFQEAPLELLENDVSTLFLAQPPGEETLAEPKEQESWILKLRGGGSLHVSTCSFSEKTANASHPLLGALEIRREGVIALERLKPDKDRKDKE